MSFIVRRPFRRIQGPILIGFNELFENAYGDPTTPRPYPKVKPARVGDLLLPFSCPHCDEVRSVVVSPKKWTDYADERGFSWCPKCKGRYVIDGKGTPPVEPIEVGASHAPALVDRKGKVSVLGGETSGFKLLGAAS